MKLAFWDKLNQKNKNIALAMVVLVLNAALIYFLILPTIEKIKNLRNEILNIEIDSANKITQERNIKDLNNKIKKIQPQLDKINSIFINQNREIEFINALEDTASKHDVSQKLNIDFNNPAKGEAFNTVPVGINANGNYDNLISYLSSIEAMSFYINIDNISFEASANNANANNTNRPFENKGGAAVDLNLTGHSYWK
jgi:Tfp pilus assembly protein PilO